ncbi:unnamed protein product, partial [Rotaria sp. Silwood1]
SVTHLELQDKIPFKHEFFIQVTRAFPSLKSLFIISTQTQLWRIYKCPLVENCSYSIIKDPHHILLDIRSMNIVNVDQFLNEFKTHLVCSTELKVSYDQFKSVTKNFTRSAT